MKYIETISGDLIYKADVPTMREAVEEAVSEDVNLAGANLRGADLAGVNLRGADLAGAKNILPFKANSSGRMFYLVNGDEIKAQAGCFWGTVQELKDKIAKDHSKETHWDYLMACDWAERLWKEEAGE